MSPRGAGSTCIACAYSTNGTRLTGPIIRIRRFRDTAAAFSLFSLSTGYDSNYTAVRRTWFSCILFYRCRNHQRSPRLLLSMTLWYDLILPHRGLYPYLTVRAAQHRSRSWRLRVRGSHIFHQQCFISMMTGILSHLPSRNI